MWIFFFFSDGGGFSQNVIFGVDMSFSLHIENENKKKDILILGKSSPGGLDTTALSREIYSMNCMEFYRILTEKFKFTL